MALSFIGAAHAATGAPAPAGSFPPFDSSTFAGQIFWLAITFGVTYYLMKTVALPRVAAIIEDRRARVANDLAEAEAAQQAAEDASKQFEAGITQAKVNAQGIGQDARNLAARESESRRHQIETELSAKMAAAERQIADTKAKAMTNVSGIAREAAAAIVERLTGAAPAANAVADAVSAADGKGA